MTTDYQPIACGAYDEIEILAMHRTEVEVLSHDQQGIEDCLQGTVVDTSIHDGAEYLVLQRGDERHEVRLDRILKIEDSHGVTIWRR